MNRTHQQIFVLDQWKFGFNKKNNIKDVFHSNNGDEETEFLYHDFDDEFDEFSFFHDKKNKIKVLSLPYKDEDISMILYLPTEDKMYSNVEKMTSLLQKINLESLRRQSVAPIQIPKFTMKLRIDDLKQIIVTMGAKDMWTTSANFKGITFKTRMEFNGVKLV